MGTSGYGLVRKQPILKQNCWDLGSKDFLIQLRVNQQFSVLEEMAAVGIEHCLFRILSNDYFLVYYQMQQY